ncbi:MAG TPA: hypothetical protein VFR07_17970 [Mycobacteriales bacterium]|nr:hypothetical protein [Mycobacteriales bacterium]
MRKYRTVLAVPALLALALTTACSAGSSTAEPSTPPASAAPSAAAPSAAAPSSAAATPPPASPAAQVQRLSLTVSGSSVTGDTGTVPVQLGRPVELTVTSDVADEVHVHGVDIGRDVPAGGTVVIEFTQTAPGRFEVELENRKRVLTRLQVS